MKKERINLNTMNNTLTPEQLAFNKFYYSNMYRLGLIRGFDGDYDNLDFYPFKSEKEYDKATHEATLLLMNYQPVPKDLEEKLLLFKQNREKQLV